MSKQKFSVNHACPCGSNMKYKKCCQVFHKGKVAMNALLLMQSRYSAYVLGDADYIIKTTNVNNPDYTLETISWKNDIIDFCTIGDFVSLEIIEFVEGDAISYVTFKVTLLLNAKDASFTEKSKFLKVNGAWQYHSAEIK